MTKTKGIRKIKHGKRHSRKVYHGGEDKSEVEARKTMTKIPEEIEKLREDNKLNADKSAYLNKYIKIQNIGRFTIGEQGKTQQKKNLDLIYADVSKTSDLGRFILVINTGELTKNDLNNSKDRIETEIGQKENKIKELEAEKKELDKKLDNKHEWNCPRELYMPYGPNQYTNYKKQLGTYTGEVERIDKKCVPNGKGTWTNDDGENTIEGTWDSGKFVDEKKGGKKKRSKKTQRKRKRKHRASSRH